MSSSHSWPIDPVPFWDDAAGTPPAERPLPPNLTDYAVYLAAVPHYRLYLLIGPLWLFVAANVSIYVFHGFYGFLNVWWFNGLAAIATVGIALGAVIYMVRSHRRHPHERRELYDAIRAGGIVAQKHVTSLKIPYKDGDGSSRVAFYIDVTLGDEWAARMRAAFDGWIAALKTLDDDCRQKMWENLDSPDVMAATEIFGPQAEGGYLTLNEGSFSRWCVLIPHELLDAAERHGKGWNVHTVHEPFQAKIDRIRKKLS